MKRFLEELRRVVELWRHPDPWSWEEPEVMLSCVCCGWTDYDVFPYPKEDDAPYCVVCMGLVTAADVARNRSAA